MILSVSATFAADEDIALSNVDDETIIDENVLSVDEDSDILEIDEETVLETGDNAEVLGTSSVVTNDTFHNYFDELGQLLDTVTDDELIFEGDFSTIDVNYLLVDKSIRLIGNNATFTNVMFVIYGDNVLVDGFTLHMNNSNAQLYIEASNVTVSNNVIDFKAVGGDNYGIYAAVVENLKILNNTITYVGATDGTAINNAIRIEGDEEEYESSSNILIEGNYFDIQMPEADIIYESTWPYASKPITEGIVFYYCEDVKFINNKINSKYTGSTGSYGTLYVVSVRNDVYSGEANSGIEIKDNEINAIGNYSVYAVRVYNVEGFNIENNRLNVSADYYYANGVDVEGPASEGSVFNNTINVKSPTAVYGIYAWQMMGGISDVSYQNNTIIADSYMACGMEINQPDPNISNNQIIARGNFTYGIAASIRPLNDEAFIFNNTITCLGNNEGFGSGDAILQTGSAAISTLGSAQIRDNHIFSTCVGVTSVDEGDVLLFGNEIRVNVVGNWDNYAVKVTEIDKLMMNNNFISFVGKTDGEKIVTNAMYVFDTEAEVSNNEFSIVLPAADIIYGPAPLYEETIISEGLVFDYVNNLLFENNLVDISYGDVVGFYDTLRGIDVSNSVNATFYNNEIVATGNNFIYAVKLGGDNFTISNNDIIATSNYYSNGINLEGASSGIIDNNNVTASSPGTSYPIYVGMTSQNIDVNITNNDIFGSAYYVVGIEVGGDETLIENNNIEVTGNHTIGIGAYVNELTVNNNNITSDASNEGNVDIWDNLGTNTTGIKVLKGNSTITNNDIRTTGDYAIDLTGNNATITNNHLSAKKGVGDKSVTNATNAVISGSTPEWKSVLSAADLYTVYASGEVLYVIAKDENGDPIKGATILLSYEVDQLTATTDPYGVAAFLVDDWNVGEYLVDISYAGNDTYGPKAIKTFISIQARVSNIVAPTSVSVLLTAVKKGSYYNIVLKDDRDNGLVGEKVTITFNGKTATYTTDGLGVIKFKLAATKVGTQKLTVKFNSNDNYFESTLTATVKITKEATKLTAAKKTYKAKVKTKKYTVTLKDSKGKAIKKAKLTLKIKGKTYKATTNAKGKAIFKIKKLTKKGKYTAKVTFAGNNLYNKVAKSVKITVK